MRFKLTLMFIISLCLTLPFPIYASQDAPSAEAPKTPLDQLREPMFKPSIQRHTLDELEQLRNDQQLFCVELIEKFAHSCLDAPDRTIRYAADTTNNIFYIIAASTTILVLIG